MPQYKKYCRKCEGIQTHYANPKTGRIECVRCKELITQKIEHDFQEDMKAMNQTLEGGDLIG